MSTVKVNMDICYSDTLADFQGCYFNYQMNLYLSRGLTHEEYLKVFMIQDPLEVTDALQRRHHYDRPEHAMLAYRNFCKTAYFTEKTIRDFFAECLHYVHWCVTDGMVTESDDICFSQALIAEILEDIASFVYRNDDKGKIAGVMGEARHLWTDDYPSGTAFLQVEGLFVRVLDEWNVEQEYVGDHHGTRMRHIFCAQSVGTQKSANVALFRGFRAYQNSRPEGDKHPTHAATMFLRINSPSWFIGNPLNVVSLETNFVAACKIITVRSKGDFFRKFEASTPQNTFVPDNGPVQDQRINLIVSLAAGKNFRHRNPEVDLTSAAGPDDVGPFGSENVHDWVNGFLIRAFGNDVVWEGSTFRGGRSRPGIYIDIEALAQIEHDEKNIIAFQEKEYRASIVGMAPKHLKGVTVPGMAPEAQIIRGEQGKSITKPLEDQKVREPVADPQKEKDDSTLLYCVLGIGAFLGLIFATKR